MGKQILSSEDIGRMRSVDPRLTERNGLKDIRDVNVDMDLPKKERMMEFIRQIGNPYCYRHGKYVVKISFVDTDVSLEDRMISYIRAKS